MGDGVRIVVSEDGPYLVSGEVAVSRQTIVTDERGQSVGWRESGRFPAKGRQALCRCGHSADKPYCDGSHAEVGFDGTETATRAPYLDQAGLQEGPERLLTDAEPLCAFARFCDADGQVWNLVEADGRGQDVDREAGLCPSGRLVSWDAGSKRAVEPELPASIGVVEDPEQGVSGPLWIRGGITVTSADGTEYEVRNRVTLCRCGASRNKPFCDGSHAAIGFDDGAVTG